MVLKVKQEEDRTTQPTVHQYFQESGKPDLDTLPVENGKACKDNSYMDFYYREQYQAP